jgi:dihydrofolate reductase
MILSLIAAVSENNVLGKDNALLWNMPADLKFFKDTTINHSIIMGRKTFDSIGRALPKRRNIVVTRSVGFQAEGCEVTGSIKEAIDLCKGEEEVFIVGGGEIYKHSMHLADRIYLTRIQQVFDGDAYFPEFSMYDWKLVNHQRFKADEKNQYDYSFSVYDKID